MKQQKNHLTILSVLLCFFSLITFGQLKLDKTSFDFGDIYAYDIRYVDFYIKNTSDKTEYVLTVEKPKEITYQLSSSSIVKDSSVALRLQINLKSKGRFSLTVPVYLSDQNEPINLRLKGNIKEVPQREGGDYTSCPNFSQKPGDGNPLDFKLKIVTVDEETRELINLSTVVLIQNGQPIGKWQTDKNGKIEKQVPLGLSYFYANHPEYMAAELGAYINAKRNYIIIPMKKRELPIIEKDKSTIIDVNAGSEKDTDSLKIIDKLRNLLSEETEVKEGPNPSSEIDSPDFNQLDKDNFDGELFNAVNVVFVIDVSSSMNQADRLELMKFSLLELTEMLRPQDRIALVSYATNANVLLNSISGEEKKRIKEEVSGIKASGLTAGGKGIKLGFKQSRKNFLKDGKNHVIIITDGAFNRNSGDYKKIIEKNFKKRGITLSVVGIKNNEKAGANMEEAAAYGNGRYVPINNLREAKNNLRQEIRKTTFKGEMTD